MGAMSKRGNRVLRKPLIDGARSVVTWGANKTDGLSHWIQALLSRRLRAKVLVAVANKITRIAWAVLSKNEHYKAPGYTS